jgi:hypothetical protein
MDCRETEPLLTAFHDGELPAAERARVEEHLRGCQECGARLADLARADRAAGVPDPGPAYWDRFNARVMDRVEREADGPGARVLRPKGGWMREQLRYLVPAAAAAALVLVIVYYGGMTPGVSTTARDGLVPGQAEMPRDLSPRPPAVPPAVSKPEPEPRGTKENGGAAAARRLPPPVLTEERSAAVPREERDRLADRSPPEGSEEASRDRAAAAPAATAPSPPPMTFRRAPDGQGGPGAGAGRDATGSVAPGAGSPPVTAADGMPPGMQAERKKMAGAADRMAERKAAGKAESASGMRIANDPSAEAPPAESLASAPRRSGSPCERALTLAERERMRDAEAAQRACLAGDLDAPSREKGLVFLAELLDRQARFSEADAVIAEVEKQYPRSRPLDLYRRQRPMVQKEPAAVPVTR